ncbi:MAG: right-handed parallel beta-helix repeat-containing protein [Deltaproteobacteria bacterium]|nr:right-handed parallel beta-helix repeat-containing protein [Deltaproteobacteria bacterium]
MKSNVLVQPRRSACTLFLAAILASGSAAADTIVPAGNLVGGSQAWSVVGSPYVLAGDVTVPAGTTLTIQAGATVRFTPGDSLVSGEDTARTELRVAGTLVVSGSSGNPARFVSGALSPAPGDFYGIVALAGATITIDGAELTNGVVGFRDKGSNATVTGSAFRSCTNGIRVDAGAPTITTTELSGHSAFGLYALGASSVTATSLRVFSNAGHGVMVDTASINLRDSVVRNNAGNGVYLSTSTGSHTCQLSHDTIYANTSRGVYAYRGTGTSLSVTVQDSIMLSNGSAGLYASNGPTFTAHHNLVYDHATNYSGVSAGVGSLVENPLLVNPTAFDLRPTHRSGARFAASDGTDMGAIPHDATALTPRWTGHLFTDTTFLSGQTYSVTGDLTVEPSVTLTIEPGATVLFSAGVDEMIGGDDSTRIELRVRGTLLADGTTSQRIRLSSSSPSAAPGDWYGVRFLPDATTSIIDFATIEYARHGIHSSAPAGTIVQRTTIQQCSSYGVNATDGTSIRLSELVIRNNAQSGVYVYDADPIIERSEIFDNGTRGINISTSGGSHSVEVTRNTIGGHTNAAVYAYRGTGTSLSVTVRDNILTSNGYGLYASNGPAVSSTYNLAWGNATDYSGVSAGVGSITENPLLVSWPGRDLRITSNSPARLHASDGTDIGARPFDGALTPTVQGHLYADTTWTGTIDVAGDVTVEPGVTLTISSATVRFAAGSDGQAANSDLGRSELRALGRLVIDGTPTSPVRLVSAAPSPAPGDWYGVHLTTAAANASIDNAEITHSVFGVRSEAPPSARVERVRISDTSSFGLNIDGGAAIFDGVQVARSAGHGTYVADASPILTNLVVSACAGNGVYVSTSAATANVLVDHATVWGNSSRGIYVYRGTGTSLSVTIRSSIIADNGTTGIYASNGPTVTATYNDVSGQTTAYSGVTAGAGSISATPQFVSTPLGNFHLLPNSPAIDVADPATSVDHDAEGLLRPLDGDLNSAARSDMGAFEHNPSANLWPNADAGPDRIAHDGIALTFDGAGSVDPDGTIASHVWSFGDGTPNANGAVVTHTFTGGTDRVVTLTVTDNSGAIDVDTVNVEVNLRPIAEAGPTRFADPGELVTFSAAGSTDSDGTITSYRWDFGDGNVGTGASVNHAYAAGGDFNVLLTVTDDDGATATDTTTARITGGTDSSPPTIVHTPVANGQLAGTAVTVAAQISDSSGVGSATLFYRRMGTTPFTGVPMSLISGSNYQGSIAAATVAAPGVEYYLQAVDSATAPNSGTVPSGAPAILLSFSVVAAPGPVIVHTPIADGRTSNQDALVTASVTAPAGVQSVSLEYRQIGAGGFTTVAMGSTGADTYGATIPGASVVAPGVEYRIRATDNGAIQATHPSDGTTHAFTVAPAVDSTPPSITLSPLSGPQPADQAVVVSAVVTDASGLGTVRLYYRTSGSGGFASIAMGNSGSSYQATIPGTSVAPPGIDYWIEAIDASTAANRAVDPAGAPATTHTLAVERVFDILPGDLVVTEIMANPTGSETQREWLEIYNASLRPIDLAGLELADEGTDSRILASASPIVVPPGEYFVLGRSADVSLNGGVTVDLVYTGFFLANTADEILILAGPTLVDRVGYDTAGTFPAQEGHSMSLEPGSIDFASNDDGASWCPATTQLGGGDFGTPGAANDPCAPAPDTTPPVVTHTFIADLQPVGQPVVVDAIVTDDQGLATVELFHRVGGTSAFASIAMSVNGADSYRGTIPAGIVTAAGVDYYLRAADDAGNATVDPAGAPTTPHHFTVSAVDGTGPSISHAPLGPQVSGTVVTVVATVTDPSGVVSVNLFHRLGAGAFSTLAMTRGANDQYSAAFAASGSSADYYFEAADSLGNVTSLPAGGAIAPFGFQITSEDVAGPIIVHTPLAADQQAGVPIEIVASVTDASGVAEVRVYYRVAGAAAFASNALVSAAGDSFVGTLPAVSDHDTVDYYLEAVDASDAQNSTRAPATAPTDVYSFRAELMEPDPKGPLIAHSVPTGARIGNPIELVATITDSSGVAGATLSYRKAGDATFEIVGMTQGDANVYRAQIPTVASTGDELEYYITATDVVNNSATAPATAPDELFHLTPVAEPGGKDVDPERDRGGCDCRTTEERGSTWVLLGLLAVLIFMRRRSS